MCLLSLYRRCSKYLWDEHSTPHHVRNEVNRKKLNVEWVHMRANAQAWNYQFEELFRKVWWENVESRIDFSNCFMFTFFRWLKCCRKFHFFFKWRYYLFVLHNIINYISILSPKKTFNNNWTTMHHRNSIQIVENWQWLINSIVLIFYLRIIFNTTSFQPFFGELYKIYSDLFCCCYFLIWV